MSMRIEHPAAIVRDREKKLSGFESLRTYRYANGVELQILVGSLPHGFVQSAVSSNRKLVFEEKEGEAVLRFELAESGSLTDFGNGIRPKEESPYLLVLDPCRMLPSSNAKIVYPAEVEADTTEGENRTLRFSDGAELRLHHHGHHSHIEHAEREGKPLKAFFHGAENALYVFPG